MADFLAVQIRLGNITIEQVPERLRNEVQEILDSITQ